MTSIRFSACLFFRTILLTVTTQRNVTVILLLPLYFKFSPSHAIFILLKRADVYIDLKQNVVTRRDLFRLNPLRLQQYYILLKKDMFFNRVCIACQAHSLNYVRLFANQLLRNIFQRLNLLLVKVDFCYSDHKKTDTVKRRFIICFVIC